MASALRGALLLLPLLVLTGCAAPGPAVTSTAGVAGRYGMSLAPSPSSSSAADPAGRAGAAGDVVRCAGPVVGTTSAAPFEGEDTGATPEAALRAAQTWAKWDGVQDGYAFARADADRRLYVFEVEGVAKQALILRHGPALKGDGTRATVVRWWLESWARCDYAELPAAVARQQGLEIWSSTDGKRQPTSVLVSFRFGAGCYPGMTALDVGGPLQGGRDEDGRVPVEYVRDPAPELRDRYFERDYAEHVTVPADAADSGYERQGDHLGFSDDRGYAYVGTPGDAEAWPRATQPIRCA